MAIVVWFVAAMSLLVAGMVHHARVDVKMAQIHAAKARSVASGDGAIQLMLAQFTLARRSGAGSEPALRGNFRLGETSVEVYMVPASGLIDVSTVPASLLSALFKGRGRLGDGGAESLAESVVRLRASSELLGVRRSRVDLSPEDLLRFPGFDRQMLDAIRDDVRPAGMGKGGLRRAVASPDLLRILGLERGSDSAGEAVKAAANDNNYRVDAVFSDGDKFWVRRRWVSFNARGNSALPWQFVRTEAPRVVAASRGRS